MKTTMTRLLAAAVMCVLPATANAAITYTVTGANGTNVSAITDVYLPTSTMSSYYQGAKGFSCVLSPALSSSGGCVFYLNPKGGTTAAPATEIMVGAGAAATSYVFAPNILATGGTYTSAVQSFRRDTITLTITDSNAPPTDAGAVPEPATWALMLTGFGLTGAAVRRRRAQAARVLA